MAEEVTEEQFAKDTLERYSGCEISQFHSNLLLTNFPRYVEYFAKTRGIKIIEGSMFKVAHSPKDDVSILDSRLDRQQLRLLSMSFYADQNKSSSRHVRRVAPPLSYWGLFSSVASIEGNGPQIFTFHLKCRLWLIF